MNNPLSPEQKEKVTALLAENQKLRSILYPKIEKPIFREPELLKIEEKFNQLHEVTEQYCSNCGEPSHNNKMNGKLWCMNCNRPFKGTYTKNVSFNKKQTFKKVSVTEEEVEEFRNKAVLFKVMNNGI